MTGNSTVEIFSSLCVLPCMDGAVEKHMCRKDNALHGGTVQREGLHDTLRILSGDRNLAEMTEAVMQLYLA